MSNMVDGFRFDFGKVNLLVNLLIDFSNDGNVVSSNDVKSKDYLFDSFLQTVDPLMAVI